MLLAPKMNSKHCELCSEKNVGPDHKVTPKHLKNKALFSYIENKKNLGGNRCGIIINCNVATQSTTVNNSAEAKIKISIKPDESAKFQFEVKNDCNKEVIILDFVQLIHSKLNFALTDSGMGFGGNPETIYPKKKITKEISVSFQSHEVGQYEVPIIFHFHKRDIDEKIIIIRDLMVFVEENERVHDKYISPYAKKEVHAEKILKSNKKRFTQDYVEQFSVPKTYKDIYSRDFHLRKNASVEEEKSFTEISNVIEGKLCKENYIKKFHNLLWYEEILHKKNIKNYNMSGVMLGTAANSTYTLVVPGLSEKRPSLMTGDMLFIKPHDSGEVMFQAYIKSIEENSITIYKLHFQFASYYNACQKFDIRFFMSRLPLVRMHQAVDSITDRRQESRVFPENNNNIVAVKKITDFYNPQVAYNQEQRRAVEYILAGTSGTAPFMVHGPPGTGKTITIVEAILQIAKQNPKNRILVCTDSNMAADHVATVIIKYKHMFPGEKFILRANSKFRTWETLPECLKSNSNGTSRNNFMPISLNEFKRYNIVVTTLLHAAKFGDELRKKTMKCKKPIWGAWGGGGPVSHLFIDEAAQASEPACLVPVCGLLARAGRLVLAGDPQQLGPVVISKGAAKQGLGLSLMERLKKDCSLYNNEQQNDPNYIVMLRNNFRSNPDILDLPNKLFYNQQLVALAGQDALSQKDILGERTHSRAIVFHGVLSQEQKVGKSPSFFNMMELEIVKRYIKALVIQHKVKLEDIGVVTPYIRQVYHVKEWLRSENYLKIEVGTVEAFQGKEKRVIIISTVRANCGLLDFDAKFRLGFLVDDKRFNVALTRAKAKVIVIGNPLCLQTDEKWRAYMDKCREFGTYLGFDSLHLTNEDTHREMANLVPLLKRTKIGK